MEEKEESIQKIYEKSYDEEYDNILVRDMQMRIENRLEKMAREYLEKLGFIYDCESEMYNGEITASDWDIENDKIVENVKFKVNLRLKYPDVRIESDYPEFSYN